MTDATEGRSERLGRHARGSYVDILEAMKRVLSRTGAIVFGAVTMLSFLLALASLSFGRADAVAFYLVDAVVAAFVVAVLMRGEMKHRRAEEAALPPELRPTRRVPRRPITFSIGASALAFTFWYVATVLIDRVVTGTIGVFTLIAIAPFAAFILATITIAGRHMAFCLTAEEAADQE